MVNKKLNLLYLYSVLTTYVLHLHSTITIKIFNMYFFLLKIFRATLKMWYGAYLFSRHQSKISTDSKVNNIGIHIYHVSEQLRGIFWFEVENHLINSAKSPKQTLSRKLYFLINIWWNIIEAMFFCFSNSLCWHLAVVYTYTRKKNHGLVKMRVI